MLFAQGASALIRLSDALKVSLAVLEETTQEATDLIEPQAEFIRESQRIAREVLAGRSTADPGGPMRSIPEEVLQRVLSLQMRANAQALNIVLLSCFTLEAYINSFAHFLLNEHDFLGLVRDGKKASSDVLYEAIERLSPRDKWNKVRRLTDGKEFDSSRSPWQDFKILFNYRDDHVHDKVVPYSQDRVKKRYGNKLPDPIGGMLDLGHALYAATTYWDMVKEIHTLSAVPAVDFHRHYNPAPWSSVEFPERAAALATRYHVALQPSSSSGRH